MKLGQAMSHVWGAKYKLCQIRPASIGLWSTLRTIKILFTYFKKQLASVYMPKSMRVNWQQSH